MHAMERGEGEGIMKGLHCDEAVGGQGRGVKENREDPQYMGGLTRFIVRTVLLNLLSRYVYVLRPHHNFLDHLLCIAMKSSAQNASKVKNPKLDRNVQKGGKSKKERSTSSDELDSIQSEGGYLTEGSQHATGRSDAESDMLSVIREKPSKFNKDELLAFSLPTTTTLVFISIDGLKTIHALDKRIISYSELQCEIARIVKKSQSMYVIQDVEGNVLPAVPFYGYDVIRVKETSCKPNSTMLKAMSSKWEVEDYYESKILKELEDLKMSKAKKHKPVVSSSDKQKQDKKGSKKEKKSEAFDFDFF